jgi:hypothetical protein
MYTKSKYVVGEIQDSNGFMLLGAVVFSELLSHSDVARVFVPDTVRSAGFCHYEEHGVQVYGESVSLNVKSNPTTDEKLVGRAMSHPKYIS